MIKNEEKVRSEGDGVGYEYYHGMSEPSRAVTRNQLLFISFLALFHCCFNSAGAKARESMASRRTLRSNLKLTMVMLRCMMKKSSTLLGLRAFHELFIFSEETQIC